MYDIALNPAYRRVSVEEFRSFDLRAPAELEDRQIRVKAFATEEHARVAGYIFAFFHARLRGTGCRPYGSDLAVRTGEATVRYPDVSVYCGDPSAPDNDAKKLLGATVGALSGSGSATTGDVNNSVQVEAAREAAGVLSSLKALLESNGSLVDAANSKVVEEASVAPTRSRVEQVLS